MKGVYEANPALGDPMTIEGKSDAKLVCKVEIDRLKGILIFAKTYIIY